MVVEISFEAPSARQHIAIGASSVCQSELPAAEAGDGRAPVGVSPVVAMGNQVLREIMAGWRLVTDSRMGRCTAVKVLMLARGAEDCATEMWADTVRRCRFLTG